MEDRSRKVKYRTFGQGFAESYESSRSCPDSWRSEPPNCTLPKPKRSRRRSVALVSFPVSRGVRHRVNRVARCLGRDRSSWLRVGELFSSHPMGAKEFLNTAKISESSRVGSPSVLERVCVSNPAYRIVSVSVRVARPASRRRLHAFCERWLSIADRASASSVSSPKV